MRNPISLLYSALHQTELMRLMLKKIKLRACLTILFLFLAKSAFLDISFATQEQSLEHLSLKTAVLFALHHNLALQINYNSRKLQRYDLITAQEAFRPQFAFTGSAGITTNNSSGDSSGSTTTKQATIGPSMTWKFPLGTELTANADYNPSTQTGSGNSQDTANSSRFISWGITLTQPLIKNFGTDVNEVDLKNAEDQQKIDTLTLEQQVISTIIQVATDYYNVVQAQQNIKVNQQTLMQNTQQLRNRKMLYKAGRIPQSDVNQAEIDVNNQKLALSQAQEALVDAKQTLLTDMGLPENVSFTVDTDIKVTPIFPNIQKALSLAEKSNRDLKIALLNYQQAQRNLLTNANNERWQLDLELSHSHSRQNINPLNGASADSSTMTNNNSVSLNLTIPLDRTTLDKAALTNAINQQNAEITLAQAKRTLRSTVTTTLANLESAWQQVTMSQQQLKLTEKSMEIAEVKFKFGKMDAFTFSQQQAQLVTAKINLIKAQINYLLQIMNYQKVTGTLLSSWDIHLVNA